MGPDWKTPTEDVDYLLQTILEYIPAPPIVEGTIQMQITSLDFSSFIGRIAIGRVAWNHHQRTTYFVSETRWYYPKIKN